MTSIDDDLRAALTAAIPGMTENSKPRTLDTLIDLGWRPGGGA